MKLTFHQIININDIYFTKAINIYNNSFPANERQPLYLIKKRIREIKSNLFVGVINEEVVCMALLWDFSGMEFVLLDYMAVEKKHRNNKFGTKLFKFLLKTIKYLNKYMIIEVENHLFGKNQEKRKKRVNFYIRNGAYVLKEIPYILPSLDNTLPTEMIIMMAPKYQNGILSRENIQTLIKRLYADLYGKNNNNKLLTCILKNIPDKISFKNNIIE